MSASNGSRLFPWHKLTPSNPGKTISNPNNVPLFTKLSIRGATLKNRVVVSPMCTYSSVDGFACDWHLAHLTQFALGGAALVFTEATGVAPEGRITPNCTGIWKDEHIEEWKRSVDSLHAHGALAGIQLAHAGRKASTYPPFFPPALQRTHVPPEKGGWEVYGVTEERFSASTSVPRALTTAQVEASVREWVAAAQRAVRAGFDVIEVHGAHGYLISTFNSPLVNNRSDKYGGSFDGRTRYLREIVSAIREVIPKDMPLFVRLSSVDGPEDGWTIEDTVKLSTILQESGVDVIDCSSGAVVNSKKGVSPLANYQVPYAEAVHKAGVKSMAVGLITDPKGANDILANGQADLIAVGRAFLHNPRWATDAATVLGVTVEPTRQYRWTYKDLPAAVFEESD